MAALVSPSNTTPQCTQVWTRSSRSLCGPSLWHREHICEVLKGSTRITERPAHAALTLTISVKAPHPASKIDLFNPAFALAPLGKYCPFSSCTLDNVDFPVRG